MSEVREDFVDVMRADRHCVKCGKNLQGAVIRREPHYHMLMTQCPACAAPIAVQESRGLARTAQRWAGLTLGVWMVLLAALWLAGGGGMFGATTGMLEMSSGDLREFVRHRFEAASPEDVDGQYETDVQIHIATSPGQQTQVIVDEQDDELLNRFGRWWLTQDPATVLADAGGIAVVPWRRLWPFLLFGALPLMLGFVWSGMLLNVSRRKLAFAWPIIGSTFVLGLLGILVFTAVAPVQSPGDAAFSMLAPTIVAASAVFLGGLLLVGLLIGRPVLRGVVRLLLSPRACSALAELWRADGKAPPQVITVSGKVA